MDESTALRRYLNLFRVLLKPPNARRLGILDMFGHVVVRCRMALNLNAFGEFTTGIIEFLSGEPSPPPLCIGTSVISEYGLHGHQ